jgi:Flp pilus assembly protein TadG
VKTALRNRRYEPAENRRGAIVVLVAIIVPVMLILSAIAINLAYLDLCRTELYTATDAATRATGREFTITQSQAQARNRGKQIARLNTVAGVGLGLRDSDFTFGGSTRAGATSKYHFDPAATKKNAVQIVASRDARSVDGAIPLFLPSIVGRDRADISQTSTSTAVAVDIALVLDRSGSMAFAIDEPALPTSVPYSAPPGWVFGDPAPPISRWRDLTGAVGVFLSEVQNSALNEMISISTYSNHARTEVSLTDDFGSILTALQPYTNSFQAGATNIGGGINEGIGALFRSPAARSHAAKVIVVMTDGIQNFGVHPLGPATNAANDGVSIFTITFSNEADRALMRQVAERGKGRHFHANSAADLVDAFRDIARGLPNLLTQ